MKRYSCMPLIVMSVLLTFAMPCHADSNDRGGGHAHNTYHHGSDWDDWAAALSLGLLGMGLYWEMTRPQYPPPQLYMQPMPEETIRPGYMYYCVYSNGYYPYVKGCPGGWLKVVPVPAPPPQ
ncbi:MAG: proline-rich region [Acidobacteria bacterium]|nr:proline-rich region [Acidobacteriota bacterium]